MDRSPTWQSIRAAIVSGRVPLVLVLVIIAGAVLYIGWLSASDYWFDLSREFGGGLAFFICFQHINRKWLKVPVVSLAFLVAALCAIGAYFASARVRSGLLSISSNVTLFVVLEMWIASIVMGRIKKREKAVLVQFAARAEWMESNRNYTGKWPWESAAELNQLMNWEEPPEEYSATIGWTPSIILSPIVRESEPLPGPGIWTAPPDPAA